jgi:hypothetical protein
VFFNLVGGIRRPAAYPPPGRHEWRWRAGMFVCPSPPWPFSKRLGAETMIESFQVGAVFRILDEASPALRIILNEVRQLSAA